jgi:HAD superfamily hydrolase (TIGR01509 family)
MPSRRRIDLVVFDCDGVLIDSEPIAARVHAEALSRLGHPISPDEIIRRFIGVRDRDMYAIIERDLGRALPADYDAVAKAAIARAYAEELKVVSGVHETLAAIELPACVASSSVPEKLQAGLEAVGLHELFGPNVFSASQVRRGKPAPDLFLFAAERMGVAPERCLVVEDSEAGVEAAASAGMLVLGFTGGSHCGTGHADRLAAAGAERVFSDMRDLPAILAEYRGTAG